MTSEEVGFSISQYADGSLPAEQVHALEQLLATDENAQKLLAEYRQLDRALAAHLPPLPEVNWSQFQQSISQAVADAAASLASGQSVLRLRWQARLAVAAAALLAIGLISIIVTQSVELAPISQITGPKAEAPSGQVIAEVEIGPSPRLAESGQSWEYAESAITRPTRVAIAAGVAPVDRNPY